MAVTQISVFAESKPGRLANVLEVFEEANVNVRGFAVSDTGEFGITRFVVDNTDAACIALDNAGRAFVVTDVIILQLNDVPGELARVMSILAKASVNVVYSYSMISTYVVICTDNVEKAEAALAAANISQATQEDIRES